jgi:hypothetical protein
MFQHKHRYIYEFELKNHPTWPGTHFTTQEYTLCTNHDGPTSKANKKLLEEALRMVYGHMPKGVKFKYEKV